VALSTTLPPAFSVKSGTREARYAYSWANLQAVFAIRGALVTSGKRARKVRTIYCKSCIPKGNRPVLASPLLLMSDFLHKLIGFHTSGLTVPKILIADDSEFLRTHLRSFLQRPDWVVCGEAANGRQAVLMASQLKPDLIVLDFAMPMLNGIQAAQEILKTPPRVPIVLYTLHKNPQLDLDATKVGISKVISKSDNANSLISSLEELLARTSAPPRSITLTEEYSVGPLPTSNSLLDLQAKPMRKPAVS
jgi:CheY-like chemotaxis protein